MLISLVATTYKREKDLYRLLESIKNSTYKNIELIIIDQNTDDQAKSMINLYFEYFTIKYIHSNERLSLSKARNIGLKYAEGDILGFPDDDCWYSESFFSDLFMYFDTHNVNAILTSVYDPIKGKPYGKKYSNSPEVSINKINAFKYSTSVGIFYKTNLGVFYFDESLGVGAKWMGGEDIDYVLNLIHNKFNISFVNHIKVYHEVLESSSYGTERMYNYSVGFGAVTKKAIKSYSFSYGRIVIISRILKSMAAIIIFSIYKREKFYINVSKIKGTLEGYRKF